MTTGTCENLPNEIEQISFGKNDYLVDFKEASPNWEHVGVHEQVKILSSCSKFILNM